MSPVIAWICCDKAFLSPHTFSTDEELLTLKNARDDYVILRHVQCPHMMRNFIVLYLEIRRTFAVLCV